MSSNAMGDYRLSKYDFTSGSAASEAIAQGLVVAVAAGVPAIADGSAVQFSNQLVRPIGICLNAVDSGKAASVVDKGYVWATAGVGGVAVGDLVVAEASTGKCLSIRLGSDPGTKTAYGYTGTYSVGRAVTAAAANDKFICDVDVKMFSPEHVMNVTQATNDTVLGSPVKRIAATTVGGIDEASEAASHLIPIVGIALEANAAGGEVRIANGGIVPLLVGTGETPEAGELWKSGDADGVVVYPGAGAVDGDYTGGMFLSDGIAADIVAGTFNPILSELA